MSFKFILMFFICLILSGEALADIVVIINPTNSSVWNNNDIQNYIKDLFLNKKEKFPNGETAKPVDQTAGKAIRHNFYIKIADKNEGAMNVYWSNLIFTGNGRTPKVVGDDISVKHFISENPNGIGYINSEQVDKTVKVIHTIK